MNIRYTEDHEWVRLDGETATVGITRRAQEALGDVVFVALPEVGARFRAHQVAGAVESVKAASDVFMPVSGEIVAVNEALRDDPSLINREPQESGWFFKVVLTVPAEFDALMDGATYDRFIANT